MDGQSQVRPKNRFYNLSKINKKILGTKPSYYLEIQRCKYIHKSLLK